MMTIGQRIATGAFALAMLSIAANAALAATASPRPGLNENPVIEDAAIKRKDCLSFDCLNRNASQKRWNQQQHKNEAKHFDRNKHWMHVHSWKWNPRLHGKRYTHRYGKYRFHYGGYFYAWPWWYVRTIGYNHVQWCRSHYRSYDQYTDTYIGRDGYRHRCRSPYR